MTTHTHRVAAADVKTKLTYMRVSSLLVDKIDVIRPYTELPLLYIYSVHYFSNQTHLCVCALKRVLITRR